MATRWYRLRSFLSPHTIHFVLNSPVSSQYKCRLPILKIRPGPRPRLIRANSPHWSNLTAHTDPRQQPTLTNANNPDWSIRTAHTSPRQQPTLIYASSLDWSTSTTPIDLRQQPRVHANNAHWSVIHVKWHCKLVHGCMVMTAYAWRNHWSVKMQ